MKQLKTCTPYNGRLTDYQQSELLELLWGSLKKEPGIDRVYTGYGSKTQTGLLACIERIVLDHNGMITKAQTATSQQRER